ncbi:MAG: hypothetical protein NVS4B5_06290 [Vulcanimicrobiaceae bacterium]
MNARTLEIVFLGIIAVLVLVGGQALLISVAKFHGIAVSVLGVLGIFLIYAFRRNFRAGGPQVRLQAARDGAFLAAIACGIAFVVVPAKWSLGATVFALEAGIVVEVLGRVAPARL